jgi:hypothetical protein
MATRRIAPLEVPLKSIDVLAAVSVRDGKIACVDFVT